MHRDPVGKPRIFLRQKLKARLRHGHFGGKYRQCDQGPRHCRSVQGADCNVERASQQHDGMARSAHCARGGPAPRCDTNDPNRMPATIGINTQPNDWAPRPGYWVTKRGAVKT